MLLVALIMIATIGYESKISEWGNNLRQNSTTDTIPHLNSETISQSVIINVVCKYLRQFHRQFSAATLPICCKIE